MWVKVKDVFKKNTTIFKTKADVKNVQKENLVKDNIFLKSNLSKSDLNKKFHGIPN